MSPLPASKGPARARIWRRGLRIARIGGIPIIAAPSWFLGMALIIALFTPVSRTLGNPPGPGAYWLALTLAGLVAILFGASVLVHELGHCLAAHLFGVRVREVRLQLLGGVSELARPPATPKEEAWIAAAGPLASAVLSGFFVALAVPAAPHGTWWLLMVGVAASNAILAVFNILPGLPLDGGRVLRAAVWRITHNDRAGTRAGAIGGVLLAVSLLIWTAWTFASGRTGAAPAAVIAGTALFIAVAAAMEWPTASTRAEIGAGRAAGMDAPWPPDMPLAPLMRPADESVRAMGAVEPAMIVLPDDSPAEAVARMISLSLPYLAIADRNGLIQGVVMRADVDRIRAAGV